MRILAIVLLLTLGGCSRPSSDLSRLSLGMSKAEVIQLLGNPRETSVAEGVEVLRYEYVPGDSALSAWWWGRRAEEPYFVRLRDGKVSAWGEKDMETVTLQKD